MPTSRPLRAAILVAAVAGATTLVGCAGTVDARPLSRPIPTADARGEALAAVTYLVECVPDELVQRPGKYVLACGDGNEWLENLTWTNWGEPTASATATLATNTCEPTCAQGQFERRPVTVSVTDLAQGEGAATYRTLTVQHGDDRPEGTPPSEQFDLPGIEPGESDQTADDSELDAVGAASASPQPTR